MTGSLWWDPAIGVASALLLAWVALVIALAILRPRGGLLREALRILPDALRLIRRLTADNTLPRGVRVRLALLMVYLAMPLDLIPDFIPVLGYADDAIIVTAVLQTAVRRAGLAAVYAHWPGSNDGFTVLCRLTGLNAPTDISDTPARGSRTDDGQPGNLMCQVDSSCGTTSLSVISPPRPEIRRIRGSQNFVSEMARRYDGHR